MHISQGAKRREKYTPLFTDTEVNNVFSKYQISGEPVTIFLTIPGGN